MQAIAICRRWQIRHCPGAHYPILGTLSSIWLCVALIELSQHRKKKAWSLHLGWKCLLLFLAISISSELAPYI